MTNLIKIAVTGEVCRPDEPLRIRTILDAGWDSVHIRMPLSTLKEVKNLIEALPQRYHDRLWLHGHFELINEFNLGGLHLNRRCPNPPANYSGALGRSCHYIEEVIDLAQNPIYQRITLSPIFDSLSKPGYMSNFSEYELLEIADLLVPVIALGGITPKKIDIIRHLPFSGYAVLGYLYQTKNIEDLRKRLEEFE